MAVGAWCRLGEGATADNWAWDSMAANAHGLSNEINDVVLGLVSPRRGLSPNSPPKVKERTITQLRIVFHSVLIPTVGKKKAIYSKS